MRENTWMTCSGSFMDNYTQLFIAFHSFWPFTLSAHLLCTSYGTLSMMCHFVEILGKHNEVSLLARQTHRQNERQTDRLTERDTERQSDWRTDRQTDKQTDRCLLVTKIPSYIQDTSDILRRLQDLPALPDNTLLVTLNVSSFYTNIPHAEGSDACR